MTEITKIWQETGRAPESLHFYEEIDSTNIRAKDLALAGAEEGTVVMALRQTSGRGRMGRNFLSPEGGLYFSLILRPKQHFLAAADITSIAAVTVCEALEELSLLEKPKIKWVNDIYMHGKKVCGILAQSVYMQDSGSFVVLGIGINLFTPRQYFEQAGQAHAGSVFENTTETPAAGHQKEDEARIRLSVCASIVEKIFSFMPSLGSHAHMNSYRKHCPLIGKEITWHNPYNEHENEVLCKGKVIGISDSCELLVEKENGSILRISDGEIHLGPMELI